MKKLYPFLFVIATPIILILMSNSSGSVGGKTGSIGDNGNTCTDCHAGTATTMPNWITTNVPPEGYTPGQTYTITAIGTHAGVVKFGFELTVENNLGAKVGTLQLTEPSRTKFTNANHAITHTTAGNVPSGNTNTWTMNWVAPDNVQGNVGIYAAFNAANGNGNTGGDVIYKSSIFISEVAPPPILVSIVPDEAEQGDVFQATITGSNTQFAGSPSVSLGFSGDPSEIINATSVNVLNPTTIQAQFSVPMSASPGLWDVLVDTLALEDGFTVLAALQPALSGIDPDNAEQGSIVTTTITAENTSFEEAEPVVSLSLHANPGEIITATDVTVINNTTLEASFDIPYEATPGLWDLHVDNLSLINAFDVILVSGVTSVIADQMNIYPNPANQRFFIDNAQGSELTILNTSGEVLIKISIENINQEVDISHLARGLYLVQIRKNNMQRVEKLLVN